MLTFNEKKYMKKYRREHKDKAKEQQRMWRIKNHEKVKKYWKNYRKLHGEEMRKYEAEYRRNNPKKIKSISLKWRRLHPEESKEYSRRTFLKYRKEYYALRRAKYHEAKRQVLTHYGGSPPKCACCGESIYDFLSIDHINGGGYRHRQEIKHTDGYRGSYGLYKWLIDNEYPSGVEILCMNCNWAKGKLGSCPHKLIKPIGQEVAVEWCDPK